MGCVHLTRVIFSVPRILLEINLKVHAPTDICSNFGRSRNMHSSLRKWPDTYVEWLGRKSLFCCESNRLSHRALIKLFMWSKTQTLNKITYFHIFCCMFDGHYGDLAKLQARVDLILSFDTKACMSKFDLSKSFPDLVHYRSELNLKLRAVTHVSSKCYQKICATD